MRISGYFFLVFITVLAFSLPACAAGGGEIEAGEYECWANGQSRQLMNFTASGGSKYKGSDGSTGTYSFDPASSRITFNGGSLDGIMPDGFYSVYAVTGGIPQVSFISARGAEAAFCQRQKKE